MTKNVADGNGLKTRHTEVLVSLRHFARAIKLSAVSRADNRVCTCVHVCCYEIV